MVEGEKGGEREGQKRDGGEGGGGGRSGEGVRNLLWSNKTD